MIILKEDCLNSIIDQKSGKIMVMIGSDSCMYCAAIKPFFETMSNVYSDIDFYFLDSSLVRTFDDRYTFEAIPTLFSFRNGELLHSQTGGSADNVIKVLDSLL